jgi:hypothetical protein
MKQCGWFNKNFREIEGEIFDSKGNICISIFGKWNEAIFAKSVGTYNLNNNNNDENNNNNNNKDNENKNNENKKNKKKKNNNNEKKQKKKEVQQ